MPKVRRNFSYRLQRTLVGLLTLGALDPSIGAEAAPISQSSICITQLGRDLEGVKDCDTGIDVQDSMLYYGLALRIGGNYRVFSPNAPSSVYTVALPKSNQAERSVEMWWCAPPFRVPTSQVLYVHSKYGESQPISLSRNSAIPIFQVLPFFGQDWQVEERRQEAQAEFCQYHAGNKGKSSATFASALRHWHDTSFWYSNMNTYDVVALSLHDTELQCDAKAERLIRIDANRDRLSWIPIKARYVTNDTLSILVVYSGDFGQGLAPIPLRYYFKPTDPNEAQR